MRARAFAPVSPLAGIVTQWAAMLSSLDAWAVNHDSQWGSRSKAPAGGQGPVGLVGALVEKLVASSERPSIEAIQLTQSGKILEADLTRGGKLDQSVSAQLGKHARNGFEGKAQIVGNISARQRQSDRLSPWRMLRPLDQKGCQSFDRSSAPEQ